MADEIEIPMTLPLDSDGFLRRECPTCEREFKWLPAGGDVQPAEPQPGGYYCPYCGIQAPADSWWTKAQLRHVRELAVKEIVAPNIRKLQDGLSRMARSSRGLITFESKGFEADEPSELTEPADMQRCDFLCHPDQPLKVMDDWTEPVYCAVCGKEQASPYPH